MTAKADATGEMVAFEYDGETYEIAPTLEWDLDVLEAYEDGKIVATVRALVGPEGWTKYRSKKRTVSDLNEFFDAIQGALGLGN
jgi:hypothetical protein